jgi:hypothetical protein
MPGPEPSKPKPEVLEQEVAALKQRLAAAETEIATLRAKLHARRIVCAAAMLGLGPDRSWVTRLSAGADSENAVLEERLLIEAWQAALEAIEPWGGRAATSRR